MPRNGEATEAANNNKATLLPERLSHHEHARGDSSFDKALAINSMQAWPDLTLRLNIDLGVVCVAVVSRDGAICYIAEGDRAGAPRLQRLGSTCRARYFAMVASGVTLRNLCYLPKPPEDSGDDQSHVHMLDRHIRRECRNSSLAMAGVQSRCAG